MVTEAPFSIVRLRQTDMPVELTIGKKLPIGAVGMVTSVVAVGTCEQPQLNGVSQSDV